MFQFLNQGSFVPASLDDTYKKETNRRHWVGTSITTGTMRRDFLAGGQVHSLNVEGILVRFLGGSAPNACDMILDIHP